MADELLKSGAPLTTPETGVAVVGTAAGATALFSAAACCVLPLAFAAVGLGAGGLASFVPYHWPLTIFSAVAVSIGWLLHFRKRRTYLAGSDCESAPLRRSILTLLCIATAAVTLSAVWPRVIEQPLMRLVGGG